jgi:predicted amidophosphoribosyltransferase
MDHQVGECVGLIRGADHITPDEFSELCSDCEHHLNHCRGCEDCHSYNIDGAYMCVCPQCMDGSEEKIEGVMQWE